MKILLASFLAFALFLPAQASASNSSWAQIFAKGSIAQNYTRDDEYTITVSASGGLAIDLLPFVKLQGRYTNILALQNKVTLDASTTLTDYETQTEIYSVGLDLSLFGPRSAFQPFIYVGGGYLITQRSFTFNTVVITPERHEGVSVNVGAGFRLLVARSIAFEVEAFGYSRNIKEPNPLINLYGNVGIRLYL